MAVAALAPSKQREWLDRCERERISKNRLVEQLATDRAARSLPPTAPKAKLTLTISDPSHVEQLQAKAATAGLPFDEWALNVLLAA